MLDFSGDRLRFRGFTLAVAVALASFSSCDSFRPKEPFDVQGHRGARGYYPENSIEGFKYAVELGVRTLEMDLVINKDDVVIVSHEPYMSADICLDSLGGPVSKDEELLLNIYKMSLEDIERFDCGSRMHVFFPEQIKMKTRKPTFASVVEEVEKLTDRRSLNPVKYNLEIKSKTGWEGKYHPEPVAFVKLVVEEAKRLGILDRVMIQSFDVRPLIAVSELYPSVPIALLVDNTEGVHANLDKLGIHPEVYSPDYRLLDERSMAELRTMEVRVIPWTVNDSIDIDRMMRLGVDGIISDYPDRVLSQLSKVE